MDLFGVLKLWETGRGRKTNFLLALLLEGNTVALRCDMRLIFLLVHVKWNRERDGPSHRSAELSCRQTLLSLQPEVAAFLMQLTFFCMVCHLCLPSLECIAEYFPLQGTNGSLFLTFKYTRRGDFFSPCCNCNSHLWRIR